MSKKFLRHNPDKRFQTVEDLKREFNRIYFRWLLRAILFVALAVSGLMVMIVNEWNIDKMEREILKDSEIIKLNNEFDSLMQ